MQEASFKGWCRACERKHDKRNENLQGYQNFSPTDWNITLPLTLDAVYQSRKAAIVWSQRYHSNDMRYHTSFFYAYESPLCTELVWLLNSSKFGVQCILQWCYRLWLSRSWTFFQFYFDFVSMLFYSSIAKSTLPFYNFRLIITFIIYSNCPTCIHVFCY